MTHRSLIVACGCRFEGSRFLRRYSARGYTKNIKYENASYAGIFCPIVRVVSPEAASSYDFDTKSKEEQ